MKKPKPVNNLFIFVDGQNFISHIQSLFPDEFDRAHYLPRTANWRAFFNSIAKTHRANTLDVYWYTIKQLDYFPHIDWDRENLDQLPPDNYLTWRNLLVRQEVINANWWKRLKMKIYEPEMEYFIATGEEEKNEIIMKWRRKCSTNFDKMEKRLSEWHELLENVNEQCTNVQIRKTGWQLCHLTTKSLGTEKAVDTGLVTDLVYYGSEYDTALVLSTDGDYVPAVRRIQKMGKQVGHVEYQSRDGQPVEGISRHLSEICDFTFEIPFEELKKFLNMPDNPVEKGLDPRRVAEIKARRKELRRRFEEKARREIEKMRRRRR